MRPKAWRELKGFDRRQIADLIGTSEVTIYRHETGLRTPEIPTQRRYEEITEGAVTTADWADLWEDPEAVKLRAEETAARKAREAKKAAAA